MGYQTPPKKVIVVVVSDEETDYNEVMKHLETLRWDYLAIPEIEYKKYQLLQHGLSL